MSVSVYVCFILNRIHELEKTPAWQSRVTATRILHRARKICIFIEKIIISVQ